MATNDPRSKPVAEYDEGAIDTHYIEQRRSEIMDRERDRRELERDIAAARRNDPVRWRALPAAGEDPYNRRDELTSKVLVSQGADKQPEYVLVSDVITKQTMCGGEQKKAEPPKENKKKWDDPEARINLLEAILRDAMRFMPKHLRLLTQTALGRKP